MLLKDKSITCAMSLANNVAKKKRSKGSSRKTLFLQYNAKHPRSQVLQLKGTVNPQKSSQDQGRIQSSSKRRSTGRTPPALQLVRTKRSKQLRGIFKRLRPDLRVQTHETVEEWDNLEVTSSLLVTTGGHTRARSPPPSLVLPGLHQ